MLFGLSGTLLICLRVSYWELGTGARCVTGSLIAQLHQELIELGGFGIAVTQYLLRRDGVLAPQVFDLGDHGSLALPQVAIESLRENSLQTFEDQRLSFFATDLLAGLCRA